MTMNDGHSACSAMKNATPKPIIAMPMARLSQCWPGNTTGAEEKGRKCLPSPASLPNAITEPENVIAPMNVPMKSSALWSPVIGECRPIASGLLTAAIAMNTAARPTSECMAATSSGICVICTRRATTAPIAPPTTIPARIGSTFLLCV